MLKVPLGALLVVLAGGCGWLLHTGSWNTGAHTDVLFFLGGVIVGFVGPLLAFGIWRNAAYFGGIAFLVGFFESKHKGMKAAIDNGTHSAGLVLILVPL